MTRISSPVDAVLLLGPTGAGKTPLGDAIARHGLLGRRCHHLDFGAELRRAASGDVSYSPAELVFMRGVLERGLLLENEHFALAGKIVSLFLSRAGFSRHDLLVLNGIPRHEGQARDMEKITRVHALFVLTCSARDVFCRIQNNVGGDRTERVDDHLELIEKKLQIFRERTAPLINHYQRLGRPVYQIGVTGSMEPKDAYKKLSALAAVYPPVSLVAEPPQG